MHDMRCTVLPMVGLLVMGCGGSAPNPEVASKPGVDPSSQSADGAEGGPQSEASSMGAQEAGALPRGCAGASSNPCVMPTAFVKRLCAGAYPEVALHLFQKDSPWTRIYVSARKVEPFNGLGGPSSDKDLLFDEELLVLVERSPNLGGMSVSGVGKSYDVLRWDGTCATLSAQEVRFQVPPTPGHAEVTWRRLDEATQNALRADEQVAEFDKARRKECKGVTMGAVSDKCEKADQSLKDRVVQAIRQGLAVPVPANLP